MNTMKVKAGLEGKKLTNTSSRKYLVQKLKENNVPPTDIMQITGHKNVQSINNYSHMSNKQQEACSTYLSDQRPCPT